MDLDWRDLISRHGHHVTQEGHLVVGHEFARDLGRPTLSELSAIAAR